MVNNKKPMKVHGNVFEDHFSVDHERHLAISNGWYHSLSKITATKKVRNSVGGRNRKNKSVDRLLVMKRLNVFAKVDPSHHLPLNQSKDLQKQSEYAIHP